jgi:hypothetical protein
VQTYDPKDVIFIFKTRQIDGFAAGTFIKASRNNDLFTFTPSNSGGGARNRNPDRSGKVEVTLLTSSAANKILSDIVIADELSATGVGEILILDRRTLLSKVQCENAWIMKPADWERQKEVGEVTWILESDELIIAHDGLIDA